ncbi:MAG TPA: hypothetical protein VE954_02840 [Oligoflexus sp.]|uniref:hypothetical protein n=1 Tax=Oligoflexus sp. TaxID=1971216 RepID=UPI002D4B3E23|nr:hypothetical protein [Oligoflexus sp.]HYX32023.1 hypothetical protein [Oligoflexus sp.]
MAADLVLRTILLPLDLVFKDNSPTRSPGSRATEAAKRSRKDWIIAATTERYSFLSYKSRPAYGLRLGYYIGKSQSLGLSLRMIQDRKFSEAEPFGEVDHKFRVQTTEIQYAYYYEFAFLRIGGGSLDTSLTTRSRETGDRIYALSPTISRFASLSIGLEYQLSDFTFSAGSQWNVIPHPQRKTEYFSTADQIYFNDTLTKGLAKKSSSSEIFLQVGYSPTE